MMFSKFDGFEKNHDGYSMPFHKEKHRKKHKEIAVSIELFQNTNQNTSKLSQKHRNII
jgi:hypothetical protein